MSEVKRYYWLKLKEDFFTSKEIKQLRKLAGGDTFTIIYLKMLLRSISENGILYFEGIEDNFTAEVALDIDEDVENVKMTVAFLMAKGILIQCNEAEWKILTAKELTGSEGESARRMRRMRQSQKISSSNKHLLASQSDGDVTQSDTEIEKEIEKEKRVRFIPPTAEQVKEYADKMGYTPKEIDPEYFVDYYVQKGWTVGKGNKMRDWEAAVRNWVRNYRERHPEEVPKPSEPEWKNQGWWLWPQEEQERLAREVEERERNGMGLGHDSTH